MKEVQNKYVFAAFIDEIECIDEECIIFSLKTEVELPTIHCYIENSLLKEKSIVITPSECFNITALFSGERHYMKVLDMQNTSKKGEKTVIARLIINPSKTSRRIKEPFEILINNTPAFLSKKCFGDTFLYQNKKYEFTYVKNKNRIEVVSFAKMFGYFPDELLCDDVLVEEERNYKESVELCKKIIKDAPGLKVNLVGNICKIRKKGKCFILKTYDNVKYKCIFLKKESLF